MGKTKYSLSLGFFEVGVRVEFEEERLYQEMKRRWFEKESGREGIRVRVLGEGRSHQIVSGELKKITEGFREGEIKPDFSYEDYVNWLIKVVLQSRLIEEGIIFLHAGGVVVGEDGVVAVVGRSGAGKSTFVSNFARERVVGDDVVVVKVGEELKVMRVWEKHKHHVGFKNEGKLRGIYKLGWGQGLKFDQVKRREILKELMESVYWSGEKELEYVKWCLRLLRRVRVGKLEVGSKFEAEKFMF